MFDCADFVNMSVLQQLSLNSPLVELIYNNILWIQFDLIGIFGVSDFFSLIFFLMNNKFSRVNVKQDKGRFCEKKIDNTTDDPIEYSFIRWISGR